MYIYPCQQPRDPDTRRAESAPYDVCSEGSFACCRRSIRSKILLPHRHPKPPVVNDQCINAEHRQKRQQLIPLQQFAKGPDQSTPQDLPLSTSGMLCSSPVLSIHTHGQSCQRILPNTSQMSHRRALPPLRVDG